jgi:hypothetical protein
MLSFEERAGSNARKPLTAQLAIAPLAGLLACCAFFLFITARFEVVAALPSVPTWPTPDSPLTREPDLRVHLGAWGFVVTTAGRDRAVIARLDGTLDLNALCSRARRELDHRPDVRVVRLMPGDGITWDEVTASYDALLQRRCADLAGASIDRAGPAKTLLSGP